MRVGVDTGGTFTDVVFADGSIRKVLSTPGRPSDAVANGIAHSDVTELCHGTTVATNALLQRKLARVTLVTNAGIEDVIEIARQDRPHLYDPFVDRPEPLVDRSHRRGIVGRLDALGVEIEPLQPWSLPLDSIPEDTEAIAVVLLHSDLNADHEDRTAAHLETIGLAITCSHDVSPEMREVERTITTVANAGLQPVCSAYLTRVGELAPDVSIMTSAGGLLDAATAAQQPARLMVSGPAAGAQAAARLAAALGIDVAVSFDMGGTSTDVCLIRNGTAEVAPSLDAAGFTIRLPSLAIHTVGAGGGSVATIDHGGALTVGPLSAGAAPGPICYGQGGTAITVTDADLVAGRLGPIDSVSFGALGTLRPAAARTAFHESGIEPNDVIQVVDATMAQAVRHITVEQGIDPGEAVLIAFGGAGPVHACAVADALGMRAVVVPPRAGVFSAVGLLAADRERRVVRSWAAPNDHSGAEAAARRLVERPSSIAFDARYRGQSHELIVESIEAFHREHQRRNGWSDATIPVEVIAIRATEVLARGLDLVTLPETATNEACTGPTAICRDDCTIWVPAGWRALPGNLGELWLTRSEHGSETPSETDAERTTEPARLAVLLARLNGIAEEMGRALRRSSFSPNIKERADSSSALFTADGELLAQAAHIPVHLGAMPASVRSAIDAVGERVRPGDHVIVNDPFAGGSHLNDVTLVSPVIIDERIAGWVGCRAHHADVGGAAPGSMPAAATHIAEEGIRIPPVILTDDIRTVFLANTRTPQERAGDLAAQIGSNTVGVQRLAELLRSNTDLGEALAYGERRMRATLATLPHGRWTFADQMDSGGAGQPPVPIVVTVTHDQDGLTFDFTGSGPQSDGNVNAVEAVTVSSVGYAVRAAIDPDLPANGGAMRAVRVICPPGSIVAATAPAAVAAGNVEVSQRIADVCFGALAQALPRRVPAASQGTMNNVLLGNASFVYYETIAGGQGARPTKAGMSGVHTAMTNTRNTPIEALERAFPLRVRRLQLRYGTGGDGEFRGGDGLIRDLEVLTPATLSLITERRSSAPWGLAGGEPGACGENWLLTDGHETAARRLADKCTLDVAVGDVIRIITPSGGGFGAAAEGHR